VLKLKWQKETVRIGRLNGWSKVAIVQEGSDRCFVVMVEQQAFGSVKSALKYAKEGVGIVTP
jgi:hypothetical protein